MSLFEPKFIFDEKDLTHKMVGPSMDEVRLAMAKCLARDVDGKIRQALIEMGWTPPTPPSPPAHHKG